MEMKKPIFWHQGMFLQPQHFQLADLHADFRLKPILKFGLPYFWGLGECKFSESSLANRILEIETLAALFPDCTYLEFPGNTLIKPRSFEGAWKDLNKPFQVFLGLKKISLAEPNVATVRNLADAASMNIRYATTHDAQEYGDFHSAGPAAEVKALDCVVHVFWEDEIAELVDYEIIPLATLEYNGDVARLSPHYIAPCYALSGSQVLFDIIKEIRDTLASRARQLEQYKSPREMQKAEFDASYMVFLLALRTVNRYIPQLYHYTESPAVVHPWSVYNVLRQLIGELSTFSERYNVLAEQADGTPLLPSYQHNDLGRCLSVAQTLISQLLNEITIGPELIIFLEPQELYLAARIPKQFFGPRNQFYLILRSEAPRESLLASFQAGAKFAEVNDLPLLVQRALPGVELIHMPAAPQGLPRRSYSYYFRIETAANAWERVEKSCNVALDWPEAPADLKVELVVLRR